MSSRSFMYKLWMSLDVMKDEQRIIYIHFF